MGASPALHTQSCASNILRCPEVSWEATASFGVCCGLSVRPWAVPKPPGPHRPLSGLERWGGRWARPHWGETESLLKRLGTLEGRRWMRAGLGLGPGLEDSGIGECPRGPVLRVPGPIFQVLREILQEQPSLGKRPGGLWQGGAQR